jgi:diacylglycerol kinase (ATP)
VSTPMTALRSSLRGMSLAARSEAAFRRELIVLALGLPIALLISEELWTWAALISVLLLILAIELLNTAIEKLCDHTTPEHHPAIGAVKDLGSAAVFCSLALAAVIWGTAIANTLMSHLV